MKLTLCMICAALLAGCKPECAPCITGVPEFTWEKSKAKNVKGYAHLVTPVIYGSCVPCDCATTPEEKFVCGGGKRP